MKLTLLALCSPQLEVFMATRDAVEDQRAGRRSLRVGPDGYFTGIVRQIADREGIDLGIKRKVKAPVESR